MPRGRPVEPVVLTGEEKAQLVRLANSRSLPHRFQRRQYFSPKSHATTGLTKQILKHYRTYTGCHPALEIQLQVVKADQAEAFARWSVASP